MVSNLASPRAISFCYDKVMQLIDTHCHIHESTYPLDTAAVLKRAHEAGVDKMICVGTSEQSSREAINFAAQHDGVYASIGVHPHDMKDGWEEIRRLVHFTGTVHSGNGFADVASQLATAVDISSNEGIPQSSTTISPKLIAIGEIGLDYFYTHSPREMQIKALEEQIDLALKYNLPIIFHVREAFDDFWPIFDNFKGIRGELHSFTDTTTHLEQGLKRGLYVGVNGISTFTKDEKQKTMFAAIPLNRLLLETDAPFLTPVPFRGKVNEPAFVRNIAESSALIRGVSLEEIATMTTANAETLFAL
jgi:TatD DNase family protein